MPYLYKFLGDVYFRGYHKFSSSFEDQWSDFVIYMIIFVVCMSSSKALKLTSLEI